SHERCPSRPLTMILGPLPREALAFSAISRQQTTSKNDTASCHSPDWRSCQRRLTARPKLAVACPLGVNRSSGSRVTLPTRVTLFPFAMLSSSVRVRTRHHRGRLAVTAGPRGGVPRDPVGDADDLVTDHFVCE